MTTVFVTQPKARGQPLRGDEPPGSAATTRSTPTARSTARTRPTSPTRSRARSRWCPRRTPRSRWPSTELDYDVEPAVEVFSVTEGSPAEGVLQVRDLVLAVNGQPVSTTDEVAGAVTATPAGSPVELTVVRDGQGAHAAGHAGGARRAALHRDRHAPGLPLPVRGLGRHRPQHRRTQRRPDVLAGHLRHPHPGLAHRRRDRRRHRHASTPTGKVGPIGGIQQKIAGGPRDRRRALPGARRTTAPRRSMRRHGDMRLVRAETMHDAVVAIEDLGRGPRRRPADLRGAGSRERLRRGPGAGRGGPGDRDPHRRGRLGPAGAALRAGRHRPARRAASRPWPARWAWTARPPRARSPRSSRTSCRRTGRSSEVLESIVWPDGVAGCAAVVERLVLPPDADAEIPEDPAGAEEFAREHPDRQEVRIVAGATRAGATYCALRLRAHDDDQSVVGGDRPGARAAAAADLPRWRTTSERKRAVSELFDDGPAREPKQAPPSQRAPLARADHHRGGAHRRLLRAHRRSRRSSPSGCGSTPSATPRCSAPCSGPGSACSWSSRP